MQDYRNYQEEQRRKAGYLENDHEIFTHVFKAKLKKVSGTELDLSPEYFAEVTLTRTQPSDIIPDKILIIVNEMNTEDVRLLKKTLSYGKIKLRKYMVMRMVEGNLNKIETDFRKFSDIDYICFVSYKEFKPEDLDK